MKDCISMGTYHWERFNQAFSGDGTTPTNQNTLNLYTIPEGSSIRRTILIAQLTCAIASGSAADLPLDFITKATTVLGLWLGDTPESAANSPSVIDDANDAGWLLWDPILGRTDSDAIAETGLYRVVWETPPGGANVQTRRNAVAGNSNDLWLGWEIFDPDGTINSSSETYNAYLSCWFAVSFLIYTP
jgi:hypothetical protein